MKKYTHPKASSVAYASPASPAFPLCASVALWLKNPSISPNLKLPGHVPNGACLQESANAAIEIPGMAHERLYSSNRAWASRIQSALSR